MNNNERVNFYLGEKLVNGEFKQNEKKMTIADLLNNNNTSKLYDIPLKLLLIKTNNQNKCFDFAVGDIEEQKNELVLSKNRCNENKDSVILRCLNFDRHWKHYYDKPRDIPFENKKNFVFWRGTTTGQTNRDANRFILVEKWFNKNCNIDVGFSHICQNKDRYKYYVKGPCSNEDFLKYKYILSVEGNDKDSGINWKLNSNSVVLMARPRVTSWLMETTLIPNYHYVLLKDDFSDLLEKVVWCYNHPQECKQIIQNANEFMKQFANPIVEQQIEEAVINKYFELTNQ
jgi:hypothetical protein